MQNVVVAGAGAGGGGGGGRRPWAKGAPYSSISMKYSRRFPKGQKLSRPNAANVIKAAWRTKKWRTDNAVRRAFRYNDVNQAQRVVDEGQRQIAAGVALVERGYGVGLAVEERRRTLGTAGAGGYGLGANVGLGLHNMRPVSAAAQAAINAATDNARRTFLARQATAAGRAQMADAQAAGYDPYAAAAGLNHPGAPNHVPGNLNHEFDMASSSM